ncbi:MAG: pyridoxal phosphate-dependent aminotransferase [Candidatus Aminicenantes bacterium]|nr:pyridoxal phosphate-dependent aminotransferase [Candidatus Aminicenantes bacterium]
MPYEPIGYMEWAKAGTRAAVNMARSGLPGLEFSDLGLEIGLTDLRLNGEHPYGWKPLIEAIAGRYGADPGCVIPSVGTSQAIFLACAAVLSEGDAVYVEQPAYEPLRSVPRTAGGRVFRFSRSLENGFGVDPAEFAERLPEGAKLVIMSDLHNPSGVKLPPERVKELAGIAADRGADVLIDEVYLEFEAGVRPHTSFGLAENIIVISSLTKAFGLSGLRCGWVLAPRRLVPSIRRVVDNLHVEHVLPAEQISARIFPLLDGLKDRSRAWIESNTAVVREFMARTPGLRWVEPDGGIVAFPRVVARGGETEGGDRLARVLLETKDTAVVPGGFFEDFRHFRLGFGLPEDLLRLGLDNISASL